MGHNYSTTITPDCEMGQHLKFEDRISIKIYRQQGHSLISIADVIGCSPSTVMYELRRCTPERNGDRGRLPSYSPKRGQANYEANRTRCRCNAKALNGNPFVDWMIDMITDHKWSIDACVGYARLNDLFPEDIMVCTETLYSAVWSGKINLTLFDLPEVLQPDHYSPTEKILRLSDSVYGSTSVAILGVAAHECQFQ